MTANDTTNISILSTGANGSGVIWDYSSLQPDELDTTIILDPALTPYAAFFPNANLAFMETDGDTTFFYFKSSASALTIEGFGAEIAGLGLSFPIIFNPVSTLIELPALYNDKFSGTARGELKFAYADTMGPLIADSIWFKSESLKDDTIIGSGELLLPSGTFYALKQKTVEIRTDSLFAHLTFPAPGWIVILATKDTKRLYTWWVNGVGIALEIDLDSLGAVENFNYTLEAPVLSIPDNPSYELAKVYPNPASDFVTISVNAATNKDLMMVVFNSLGQMVDIKTVSNRYASLGSIQLNLHGYPEGIYYYSLKDTEGNAYNSGKFVVSR